MTWRRCLLDSFGEIEGRDVISTSPVVLIRHGDDGDALFSLDDETGKVHSQFSPATPSEYVRSDDSLGGPWSFHPLPAAGADGILAYETGYGNDKGPEPVEFDPTNGAMKTVVENPTGIRKGMSISARPYWHENRLSVAGPNPSVSYGETPYTLVTLPTTTDRRAARGLGGTCRSERYAGLITGDLEAAEPPLRGPSSPPPGQ